jgi:predicted nuclease with TOPRIM domain
MERAFYEEWWPLHLRTVRGETLSPEENALYRSGLKQLDDTERFPGQEEALRQLRDEIQEAAAENAGLQKTRKELETQINALEALLAAKQQPA